MTVSTFKLKEDKKTDLEDDGSLNEFYIVKGREEFIDEQGYPRVKDDSGKGANRAYAKLYSYVDQNGSTKKKGYALVSETGLLYDPFGPQGFETLDKRGTGRLKYWELQAVPVSTFNMYIDFLKTKNNSRLNNAQREYNNG